MTRVAHQGPAKYFRLLNLGIRITAPDARMLRSLVELLGPFQCDPFTSVTHEIELRYGHSSGRTPAIDILINGRRCHRAVPRGELVPYLEWMFNDLVVRTNERGDRYCLIHAAVLARGTQCILLCGEAGCGKSSLSLALALMHRHYRYLTDEVACWDPRAGNIVAYPKAITLKEYGYRCFRRARIPVPVRTWHTKAFKGKVSYINPRDISPRLVSRAAKVRLVIFPGYRPQTQPRLRPVPKARAIVLLHKQRFDGDGFGKRDFEALTDLVREAPAYRLLYQDVFEAARVIDRLAKERGRT